MNGDSSLGDKPHCGNVCGVSIQSRIIPFWREFPSVWFAQFEAVVEPFKQSDEHKYTLLLQQLKEQDLRHVTDILKNPPATKKYAIKQRLIAAYEETNIQSFEKLIAGLELGDSGTSSNTKQNY